MSIASEVRQLELATKAEWMRWSDKGHDAYIVRCGTLTVSRWKHAKGIAKSAENYFSHLAKLSNRHWHVFFGVEPDHTKIRDHIHYNLYFLNDEGHVPDWALDRFIEANPWPFGKHDIGHWRGGNYPAYACMKHDGPSSIVRTFCPKTGACSRKAKSGKRQMCKFSRNPKLLRVDLKPLRISTILDPQ